MNELDIDERVTKMRACSHDRWHYRDANGNRRCWDCGACVRPNPIVPIVAFHKEVHR
ncbi:Uncharacterised protein [Mycobacteroides abscessus subsp. massiliense]|uniref:hypothetical protein n=1 Tax=Mycobacteroides TaxID=670516 RepID=UPI000928408C|nr:MULTISPECIES: hypothetical protein [Mycobacteroides]SIK00100.1 Uncharacterised protein [Mycobacteroides abscessus subsp. bolletii]MDM2174225.1 hypothetical protein [Mycobacteroides abscessus]MDM2179190.1 hypothetical protein [Mycobacteroides abscessus]MDM2205578.1 hypothetical protein [Mycobacteroides abscessus]MDM2212732.1 hypothetical protein [Mycobacteroides abscessus]